MQVVHYENIVIRFSGMAMLNEPGVDIAPSNGGVVPAQSSCSWGGGERLPGGKGDVYLWEGDQINAGIKFPKVWQVNCIFE